MTKPLVFRATTTCFLNRGAVTSIRFIPQTNLIAVATASGTLFIFELGTKKPTHEFAPVTSPINEISWNSETHSLYAITENGSIWGYGLSDPFRFELIFTDGSPLLSCSCSPTEKLLLTGSTTGILRIRNLEINEEVRPYIQAHTLEIPSISWRSDGLQFVTSSYDGMVRVWLRSTFHCIASFPPGGPATFVKYRPSGQMLLVLSGNKCGKLFSVERPSCKRNFVFDAPLGTVLHGGGSLRTTLLNEAIVVATNEGAVLFFFESSSEPVLVINAHQSEFRAIDFHGRMATFATGGGPDDQTLKIWTRILGSTDDEGTIRVKRKYVRRNPKSE